MSLSRGECAVRAWRVLAQTRAVLFYRKLHPRAGPEFAARIFRVSQTDRRKDHRKRAALQTTGLQRRRCLRHTRPATSGVRATWLRLSPQPATRPLSELRPPVLRRLRYSQRNSVIGPRAPPFDRRLQRRALATTGLSSRQTQLFRDECRRAVRKF